MIQNPSPSIVTPIPKTDDETVTSSAVLQADDELVFPVVADGVYIVEACLYSTFGEGDIQVGFSGPATNFVSIRAQIIADGNLPAFGATSSLSTGIPLVTSSATEGMIKMECAFAFSASGTLSLVWAQNSSNGTGTTVKAGSYLIITQVE